MTRLTVPSALLFLAACNACSEVPADSDDRYDEDNPASQARLPRGQLECDIDGSTPDSTILLGASTGNPVAIFSCTARGEDVVLKRVQFNNCLTAFPDDDADCADSGEVPGSDAAVSSVSLTYLDVNGVAVTKTGTLTSGKVVFNQMNAYFPKDTKMKFAVSIDTNVVDGTTVPSGEQIQMNWNTLPGVATFRAVGVTSGLRVHRPASYILPDPFVVRKTKPTVTLASGSPSGVAIPGPQEVLRFNIAADARGDVDYGAIMFELNSTDNDATGWNTCGHSTLPALDSLSAWTFYDADDPSTPLLEPSVSWYGGVWSVESAASPSPQVCNPGEVVRYVLRYFNVTIPAGTTKTYIVKMDSTGASTASNDVVQLNIMSEVEVTAAFGSNASSGGMCWVDGVYPYCINGDLVKNLPVLGGTLVFGSNP